MTAEDFIHGLLIGTFKASHLVAGYDFNFGKGRLGTPAAFAKQKQ